MECGVVFDGAFETRSDGRYRIECDHSGGYGEDGGVNSVEEEGVEALENDVHGVGFIFQAA